MMSTKPRLFIATIPKSRSTALARTFGNIPKSLWMLEPFMLPWHKSCLDSISSDPTRINLSNAYKSYWDSVSFEKTLDNILQEDQKQGNDLLTVKDHAYAVSSCIGAIDELIEKGFKFLLLVRDPICLMQSDLKANTSNLVGETMHQYYEAAQLSYDKTLFKASLHLLKKLLTLKARIPENSDFVRVIDAETLSTHPDKSIKVICDWIGIPYNPSYLKWRPMPKIFQKFSSKEMDADSVTYETYEFPHNCVVDQFTRELNAAYCFFNEALKSVELKKLSTNKANPPKDLHLHVATDISAATDRYITILKLAKNEEILIDFV